MKGTRRAAARVAAALLPLLLLAVLCAPAASKDKPSRTPSGATARVCPAAAPVSGISGRWVMRSKLDDGASSQRPGTIQCLPFQGVPIYQTPFKRLYNLPKALGGPGFYEGVIPPVNVTDELPESLPGAKLRVLPGQLPDKYEMRPCSRKGFRSQYVYVPTGSSTLPDLNPRWAALMDALAGRHLLMLGDSVMRQVGMALMCAWRRAGIVPTSATFATEGDVSVTYPNGLVLSRWTMQLVDTWYHEHLEEVLAGADVVMANIGRHYSFLKGKKHYNSSMEVLAGSISKVMGGRSLLLETLPAHFPKPSGDFTDPRSSTARPASRSRRSAYACKMYSDEEGANWQNAELSHWATVYNVTVVKYAHVMASRFDGHVGTRRNTGRMDCLHWCYAEELFDPLLSALSTATTAALACPGPQRDLSHAPKWRKLIAELADAAWDERSALLAAVVDGYGETATIDGSLHAQPAPPPKLLDPAPASGSPSRPAEGATVDTHLIPTERSGAAGGVRDGRGDDAASPSIPRAPEELSQLPAVVAPQTVQEEEEDGEVEEEAVEESEVEKVMEEEVEMENVEDETEAEVEEEEGDEAKMETVEKEEEEAQEEVTGFQLDTLEDGMEV